MKILYRIECVEIIDVGVELRTREYRVIRETEKSFFIQYKGKEKRVSKVGKALFAHDTIEKAQSYYWYRTQHYILHLRYNLKMAEQGLKLISQILGKENKNETN